MRNANCDIHLVISESNMYAKRNDGHYSYKNIGEKKKSDETKVAGVAAVVAEGCTTYGMYGSLSPSSLLLVDGDSSASWARVEHAYLRISRMYSCMCECVRHASQKKEERKEPT